MKIILGTFKDSGDELAEFLEPRLGAKLDVSGGELSVDDDSMKKTVNARHVKTYVKRFLWKKGERKNYRVLVEGKELRLIELEGTEAEEEEKKKEEARKEERAEKEAQEKKEAKGAEPAPQEEGPAEEAKVETSVEQEKKPPVPKTPRETKKGKKNAEK
ncbi:MAG: hypothetical protein OK474_09030 [Thaumarchaeota archaeon]|nr:hypothetical protein [Nitrososphaerota archaeon]